MPFDNKQLLKMIKTISIEEVRIELDSQPLLQIMYVMIHAYCIPILLNMSSTALGSWWKHLFHQGVVVIGSDSFDYSRLILCRQNSDIQYSLVEDLYDYIKNKKTIWELLNGGLQDTYTQAIIGSADIEETSITEKQLHLPIHLYKLKVIQRV